MFNFLQTGNNKVENASQLESPNLFVKEPPVEDSVPQLLKNGSKDISDKSSDREDEEIGSRHSQNIFLYLINVVLSFVISFQNIIYVFTDN